MCYCQFIIIKECTKIRVHVITVMFGSFLHWTHAEFRVGSEGWTHFCCKTTNHVQPKANIWIWHILVMSWQWDSVDIRWFLFKMLWLEFTSLITEIERGGWLRSSLCCRPQSERSQVNKSHTLRGSYIFRKRVNTASLKRFLLAIVWTMQFKNRSPAALCSGRLRVRKARKHSHG